MLAPVSYSTPLEGRSLARREPHGDVEFAAVADHGEHDFLARLAGFDQAEEVVGCDDLLAVDGHDQVG